MEKKTVSRKLYIITIIVLLILAGYLYIGWRRSTYDERYAMGNFEMLESTLRVTFPEGSIFYEVLNTRSGSPRGDGDVSCLFIIPPHSMDDFAEQLKQLGWIEYTSDMFDDFSEEYSVWRYRDYEEIPSEDFTHGYAIFLGDGEDYDESYVFYDSNGDSVYSGNEAMLFFDTVTGRLYFFTHTS